MLYKISLVFEVILIAKCLADLYGNKNIISIQFLLFVASDLVLYESIIDKIIPNWCGIFIYPIIGIYCIVTYGLELKKIFVNMSLTFIFMGLLQILCINLLAVIIGNNFDKANNILLVYAMMFVLYFIVTKYIKLKWLSQFFARFLKEVCYILFGSSLIIAIAILITRTKLKFYGIEYLPWTILIFIALILSVVWIKYKEKSIMAEAELKAYELYQESYENLISEIRLKQHDFNEHINTIYNQHIIYKDYDSLVEHQKQYCDDLIDENKYARLLKLGDTALVGYLYSKFLEAERKQIQVEYKIENVEIIQIIPIHKIIEMIGNLIKNAIDALEKTDDKKLNIMIYDEERYSFIKVENTGELINQNDFSEIFTSGYSTRGKNRGLGLVNIKQIARDYNLEILCGNDVREDGTWVYFIAKKDVGTHQ